MCCPTVDCPVLDNLWRVMVSRIVNIVLNSTMPPREAAGTTHPDPGNSKVLAGGWVVQEGRRQVGEWGRIGGKTGKTKKKAFKRPHSKSMTVGQCFNAVCVCAASQTRLHVNRTTLVV